MLPIENINPENFILDWKYQQAMQIAKNTAQLMTYKVYKRFNNSDSKDFNLIGGQGLYLAQNIRVMNSTRNFRLLLITPNGAFLIKSKQEKPFPKITWDIIEKAFLKNINS